MENLCQDVVLLQSFRLVQSVSLNTGASSESEQEEQTQLKSDTQHEDNQETEKPRDGLQSLSQIEKRMQKLKNRLLILLKSQEYRQKAEQNGKGIPNDGTSKDNGELEAIQEELQELQELKKELEANRANSHPQVNGGGQEPSSFLKEGPRSGIYLLPPIQSDQDVPGAASRPAGPVIPVESLKRTAEVTKCPSCEEVVLTETHSTVGEAMWIMCVLCSLLGCVAGCCLVPFGMKHLRNVSHQCPRCQARIHTFQPF